MSEHRNEKGNRIQLWVISGLIVVVAILSFGLIEINAKLEALSNPHEPQNPVSRQNEPDKSPQTKSPPFDIDDDWFSTPFDPHNWDPFAEMQRMNEHMNRMFNDALGHFDHSPKYRDLARDPFFSPKIDVQEEKDRFVIRVDVPGVDSGSIDVHVDGNRVRISGKRESTTDATDKSGRVVRGERRYGQFARTIELPEPVDESKMEGKSDKGVFTIILPKKTAT